MLLDKLRYSPGEGHQVLVREGVGLLFGDGLPKLKMCLGVNVLLFLAEVYRALIVDMGKGGVEHERFPVA